MDDRGDDSYGFSKRNLYEDLIKALRAANDSGATTNNNTSRNVQVDSTDVFLVSLTLNAILTLLVFALFCLLRPRMQRLYSPRLLLIKPVSTFVKYSDSLFGWLLPAMTVTDDSIFNDIGIDALVYIRLIKLCFKISLVILPYGIIVLLPLNLHGGLHLSGLDKLTMSNMHEKSTKAWAHLVGVWAYTLIICYLLYKEWQVYLVYRRKHLAKGLPHQYAVLLRGLTSKLKNRETLRKYADGIFPGQVVQVIMVENLKNWNALVAQHDKSILALEKAKFKLLANGKRPQHRVRCFGKKTDTIIFHKNNLKTLHGLLEEEIERDRPFRPSAFIVFRSLRVASMAAQVLWDDSVRLMNVQPAPDKHDVNWTSLSVGFVSRMTRQTTAWAVVFVLMFFYTIPTGFVSSLIAFDKLKRVIPALQNLNTHPLVSAFIQGFLSSIVMTIFVKFLPKIMHYITRKGGFASKSEEDELVLNWLYMFKTINNFLFVTIASSALTKLEEIMGSPKMLPQFLAKTLPTQSTFFITFIILKSLTGFSLELLRWFHLILVVIRRCMTMTPRQEKTYWLPQRLSFDGKSSENLHVFTIGICFSVLAPLVAPFVVLYFTLSYCVWTYQIVCVYVPTYNSGGQLWPVVFSKMIASLLLFHFLMVGYFGLKKIVIIPFLVLPLPFLTCAFYLYIQRYHYRSTAFLSQESARGSDEAPPTVIEAAREIYLRRHHVPPLQTLSTDQPGNDNIPDDDFEDETSDSAPLNTISAQKYSR